MNYQISDKYILYIYYSFLWLYIYIYWDTLTLIIMHLMLWALCQWISIKSRLCTEKCNCSQKQPSNPWDPTVAELHYKSLTKEKEETVLKSSFCQQLVQFCEKEKEIQVIHEREKLSLDCIIIFVITLLSCSNCELKQSVALFNKCCVN